MWRFILFLFISRLYATVPFEVEQLLFKHNVPSQELSLYIQEFNQAEPLVALNIDTPRNPASVAKLLTTGAGLSAFGSDFRWQTQFFIDAPVQNGVLNGNLYVKGGGDPFLVEERLQQALRDLQGRGLQQINGNLVLDDSLFNLSASEKNPYAFDGEGQAEYNAIPHPLMVNFRLVDLIVSGKSASFRPNVRGWKINNQLQLTKAKCRMGNIAVSAKLDRQADGSAVVNVVGRLPKACPPQSLKMVFGDGNEVFGAWFQDMWQQMGGVMTGKALSGRVPQNAKLFYAHQSVPLSQAIASMNQHSNNVMTRQLFLTLSPQKPATLKGGQQGALQALQKVGVQTQGIVLENGSGLSRIERVSVRQLMQLLKGLAQNPDFVQSMAVSGESGTLKNRFKHQPLHGKIYGKTGTIKNVRAFAGYVQSASGRWFMIAIIGNGASASASRNLQDDVFKWLYSL